MDTSAFPLTPTPHVPAILIVDDAPASLGALRTMMSSQGYQTFVATSGERALSIAQRVRPDLILLDVVMPGIDGLETCRRLKGHPGTQQIPVIFMSAKSDTDDIVAGFDIGAVDYIGKPLRMAEVCARVRAQLQLRCTGAAQKEQADRLRMIVDAMDEGLMVIEASGRIQYSNPACERYLGYGPDELAGHAIPELLGAALAQEYLDYFAACAADPAAAHQGGAREVLIRHHDGSLRSMDLTLTPMVAGEPLFIGLLHDITHHKQSETALQHAAMVDQLTQIANRRRFDSFLEQEWLRALRSGQPLSLIVLDVDHFKLYNDTLGHAAGDLCLQKVAAALQSRALRPTDLAARYGGEEFVLLFAETTLDTATVLAESIRALVESLRLPHPRSTTSPWLTVSIGVATIAPTQFDRVEQFFVAADRMMYAAKDAGRNRVMTVNPGGQAWETLGSLVMI
ncbi:MAG: response regulator receiver modulated diguanylate cyclase [Massilia sp.]|jgi:two-component system cell cycle response regulator|nr:response regulator receiver modulated diguanylate cyclase [Massilia sp.]